MSRPAAIYVRISQDRDGASVGVDRQERECRELAERRGWDVAEEVFRDNDTSAYSGKRRPGYEALLAGIEAGRFGGLLAWHPDRLHRRQRELEHFIDVIEAAGIEVATVTAGDVDLATAEGRMLARITGAVAQHSSDHAAERIQAAAAERARAGGANGGGSRPFGWVDRARSALHPDEAPVVREAADLALHGASLADVTRHLASRSTTSEGRTWTVEKMRRLLTAASLAGLREHKGDVVARDCWPAIVSEAEHEALREALAPRRGQQGPRTANSYLLSGLAVCGACGTPLIAQPYRGKRAYRCPQQSRVVNGRKGCGGSRILAEVLDEHVVTVLMAFVVDPDRQVAQRQDAAERDAQTITLRAELSDLDARQRNLTMAVEAGLPIEEFRRSQAELTERRQATERRLAELSSALDPAVVAGSTPLEARRRFDGLTLGEQRRVVHSLLVKPPVVHGVRAVGSTSAWERIDLPMNFAEAYLRAVDPSTLSPEEATRAFRLYKEPPEGAPEAETA